MAAGIPMIFTGDEPGAGSSWSPSAEIGGAPGSPDAALTFGYDQWKVANGITDDNSDTDSDGLTAFAEYATGNDPDLADASPITTRGLVTIDSEGFLSITFQQGSQRGRRSF